MLSNYKQYFYNPSCMNCGSFFVEDYLYCKTCFQIHVLPKLNFNVLQLSEQSQHAYLVDWVPGESDLISEMVYRFKSNRSLKAWAFYAEIFAQNLCEQIDILDFDALVPLPGSSEQSTHAWIFAKNLSYHTGLPLLDGLRKEGAPRPQKEMSAHERRQKVGPAAIHKLEQFTKEDISNLKLIYVDDIMTTGATYKQSQDALQNNNKSLLVTLFYRPRAGQT